MTSAVYECCTDCLVSWACACPSLSAVDSLAAAVSASPPPSSSFSSSSACVPSSVPSPSFALTHTPYTSSAYSCSSLSTEVMHSDSLLRAQQSKKPLVGVCMSAACLRSRLLRSGMTIRPGCAADAIVFGASPLSAAEAVADAVGCFRFLLALLSAVRACRCPSSSSSTRVVGADMTLQLQRLAVQSAQLELLHNSPAMAPFATERWDRRPRCSLRRTIRRV